MFDYPYVATRDGNGWLVTFPDVPGVNTDAETEAEIPQRAHDALWTMLEAYVRQRRELPAPTYGPRLPRVNLGAVVDLKLMLHQAMVWNGYTQAELVRRLGWSATLVNRLLDLDHVSKLAQIRAAMDAINVRPVITYDPASDIPVRVRRADSGFVFQEPSRPARSAARVALRSPAARVPQKRVTAGSRKRRSTSAKKAFAT